MIFHSTCTLVVFESMTLNYVNNIIKLPESSKKIERDFDFAGCQQHRLLLKIFLVDFANFINSLIVFMASFISIVPRLWRGMQRRRICLIIIPRCKIFNWFDTIQKSGSRSPVLTSNQCINRGGKISSTMDEFQFLSPGCKARTVTDSKPLTRTLTKFCIPRFSTK